MVARHRLPRLFSSLFPLSNIIAILDPMCIRSAGRREFYNTPDTRGKVWTRTGQSILTTTMRRKMLSDVKLLSQQGKISCNLPVLPSFQHPNITTSSAIYPSTEYCQENLWQSGPGIDVLVISANTQTAGKNKSSVGWD